ncbi:MAG: Fic family protein [Candidatus Moraniibacteriota bacterium]|nr:MAG: Fic family protein [Candidatus Moranbacteria bacterium]
MSFPLVPRIEKRVEAIVESINSCYFGHELYASSAEKTLAYLYFLIKDHPFTDGNKRTACLVFSILSQMNALHMRSCDVALDELAVFLERDRGKNHREMIHKTALLLFLGK